jgi:hypothetical protein
MREKIQRYCPFMEGKIVSFSNLMSCRWGELRLKTSRHTQPRHSTQKKFRVGNRFNHTEDNLRLHGRNNLDELQEVAITLLGKNVIPRTAGLLLSNFHRCGMRCGHCGISGLAKS